MTWTDLPESIIANIAIFLVEYRLVACWTYRAEKDSYIEMPSPRCYNGGWKTIVALPSKVMIICPHYLDVFSFPFVDAPCCSLFMTSLMSPHSVLDILRTIAQLCTEVEHNQILINVRMHPVNNRMVALYLSGDHLFLGFTKKNDITTRILGCCLANHIVGPTQSQTKFANQHVATKVVRWLLACSTQSRFHYMRTSNDNNPDGALLFRLFPSGSRLSMTSLRFQHGSAVARSLAGHGREVDIKRLPVSRIPGH